ncbi:MAG TPA: tRNA (adenosine(37)-N6)-threonylcarbamoyltransferase complex dimerization subunit type 1 TsaB [Candidatus Babeliales bacterium]|nr:tRNA (adenosine(37)-N6)-threonylcarbamoyltransferase complex dimerization subunit type 1 TsaB [Candidatus Babeliales bacterium]
MMRLASSISNKNAKTENRMSLFFLAVQATYTSLEVGIYRDQQQLAIKQLEKTSSNLLIDTIAALLKQQNLSLINLAFIAVNRGPAPFTSLRVALATVNGIAFSSGIKLVGVDGLRTFAQAESAPDFPPTAFLLNAFNNDVYYAVKLPNTELEIGCAPIDDVLSQISKKDAHHWRFMGNGAILFKEKIDSLFKKSTIETEPIYPSLLSVAHAAFSSWQKKALIIDRALPLYLKETHYKKSALNHN